MESRKLSAAAPTQVSTTCASLSAATGNVGFAKDYAEARIGKGHESMDKLPDGMVAWTGGDSAPEDWDGGPVLFRSAGMSMPFPIPSMAYWTRGSGEHPFDIIAYTPRYPVGRLDALGATEPVEFAMRMGEVGDA